MRGGPLIGAGIVLAIVAAAVAIAIYQSDFRIFSGDIDVTFVFPLAALAGLGLAGYGAYLRIVPLAAEKRARNDAQVIFRAMLALAGVDGKLHPDEIMMIQRCCRHFFKRNMSHTEIRKAFDHSQHANFGGFAFQGIDQRVSPEANAWAFTGAVMTAGADGPLSEAEKAKLERLAGLLGLDAAAQSRAAEEAARLKAGFAQAGAPPTAGPV